MTLHSVFSPRNARAILSDYNGLQTLRKQESLNAINYPCMRSITHKLHNNVLRISVLFTYFV